MIVITSGKKYVDIDGYASMIAYRELLKSLGEDAYAMSSAQPNSSVPPLIKNLSYRLDQITPVSPKYILVDISNPDFTDSSIKNQDIIEVIDHHTGFENYWQAQGIKAEIEFIGSVCTMIFEKIVKSGKTEILTPDLCKLLIAGILDNTLNLRSSITTQRDITAYQQLKNYGDVPESYRQDYFNACDAEILQDYQSAILNDLKNENVSPLLPHTIGQLVLLDASKVNYQMLASVLKECNAWMVNIIDLNSGQSYLYFAGDGVKAHLEKLFNQPSANDHLLILDQFLLRKQIIKKAREQDSH